MAERATFRVKTGLAEMLKGGVIMDVTDAEQAKIAEDAGACAVMALERVPADIRAQGGVARMSNPAVIKEIQEAVTIPVMAKARIGHFAEAQVLQSLEVDYIDESEVLTPADEANHIDKLAFEVPFVCGATNLGEALRRIGEGAAMIRSKGEAGTGNIVEAVRHMRAITDGIKQLATLRPEQLAGAAKEHQAPLEVVQEVAGAGLAARAALLRRRHRHPRRRGADDAARRRGQLRRLRDLQVAGPRAPRPGDRRGDDPLRGPRARRHRPRWSSATRCPAWRSRPSPQTAGCFRAAALDGRPCAIGRACARPGRLRGPSPDALRRSARRRPRSARPSSSRDWTASSSPAASRRRSARGWSATGSTTRSGHAAAGRPILGSCAGMIVCDREHLGIGDYLCRRNAFGRQLPELRAGPRVDGLGEEPLRAVFIRAPWVEDHGPGVEVLAEIDGHPVAVRDGNLLAVAFHAELTDDSRLHASFMAMVTAAPGGPRRCVTHASRTSRGSSSSTRPR